MYVGKYEPYYQKCQIFIFIFFVGMKMLSKALHMIIFYCKTADPWTFGSIYTKILDTTDLLADFISFSSFVLCVQTGQMYSLPARSILLPWLTEIPTQSPWNHSSHTSQHIMNLSEREHHEYIIIM